MRATTAAQPTTAKMLAVPVSAYTLDGSPKIPAPIMPFRAIATRSHLRMALTSPTSLVSAAFSAVVIASAYGSPAILILDCTPVQLAGVQLARDDISSMDVVALAFICDRLKRQTPKTRGDKRG